MMPKEEFAAALDTLAVYASVYSQLSNAMFESTKEEQPTLPSLENLIAIIVEELNQNPGQVA